MPGRPWWFRLYGICLQCRRPGFEPWVRKIPWRRKSYPSQYSCLENSMDRRAWQAIVHGVTKSQTWLTNTQILCLHYESLWLSLRILELNKRGNSLAIQWLGLRASTAGQQEAQFNPACCSVWQKKKKKFLKCFIFKQNKTQNWTRPQEGYTEIGKPKTNPCQGEPTRPGSNSSTRLPSHHIWLLREPELQFRIGIQEWKAGERQHC